MSTRTSPIWSRRRWRCVNLHNDLLIHVTRFFREPESFEHRARCSAARFDVPSRRTSAHVGRRLRDGRRSVFAGDRRPGSAGRQARGRPRADFRHRRQRKRRRASRDMGYTPRRLPTTFRRSGCGGSSRRPTADTRSTKSVRDMCVFARQDLTRDPPFSHLDLICCRNVLIYMDSALQRKLLSMFHYALKPQRLPGARPRRKHRISL